MRPLGDWQEFFNQEFEKPYMKKLMAFLEKEYSKKTICPDLMEVFKAFELTPYEDLRVVILGQDPYTYPDKAMGLAFSVPEGYKPLPGSLKNIFKESGQPKRKNGDLSGWARQGVLLLNTTLTVELQKPKSHAGRGWEKFTDSIITKCDNKESPVIFVFWGLLAKKKKELIRNKRNITLSAAHPSPLSAHNGFLGCNHFELINKFLKRMGQDPIDWSL